MNKGPTYYQRGKTEVWDFIREQELNYHLGCAVKYIARAGHKESKIQDLTKAIHYLQNELENTINASSPRISYNVQTSEYFIGDDDPEVFDR
jgi:hypothetical protein